MSNPHQNIEDEEEQELAALLAARRATRAKQEETAVAAAEKVKHFHPGLPEVGSRVSALVSTDPDRTRAYVLGAGVYVGEEVPPPGIGEYGGMKPHEDQTKFPKIQLDSGAVVYGCECHWGLPEDIQLRLVGLEQVEVTVEQLRSRELP